MHVFAATECARFSCVKVSKFYLLYLQQFKTVKPHAIDALNYNAPRTI